MDIEVARGLMPQQKGCSLWVESRSGLVRASYVALRRETQSSPADPMRDALVFLLRWVWQRRVECGGEPSVFEELR
eukprot:3576382-Lingulodinium_polyedra.AAC.1